MDTIVAHIGLRRQAQLLPICKDLATKRVRGSLLRVRGAQELATEVLPRQILLIPLHAVIVDAFPWRRERCPHGHEEAIEHVDRVLALCFHQAAVETATEFDQLLRRLARPQSSFSLSASMS